MSPDHFHWRMGVVPIERSVMPFLRGSISVMVLSLSLTTNLVAQVTHLAVCQSDSGPAASRNAPLTSKVIAEFGDASVIASLKAIRYTFAISTGTDGNRVSL